MRSLSLRVTLLAGTILVASLGIATAVAYELFFAAGRDHLDSALHRETGRFQRILDDVRAQDQRDDRSALRTAVDRYLSLDPGSDTYYTMINIDGSLRTSVTGPDALLRLADARQLPVGISGRLHTVSTPQGDVRILTTQVPLSDGSIGATLAVAGSLDEVRADSFASLRRLLVAGGISLLAGSVFMIIAMRTTLKPLRAVASAARATDLDSLDTRVPEPKTKRVDEIAVLAHEFNRMLDRLENAAEARREFLASVSHELRTPLTIARGHLEVFAGSGETDTESVAHTVDVVSEELRHMGRLVEDLMTLAHSADEGFVQPQDMPMSDFFDDLRLRLTGLNIDGIHLHEPSAHVAVHGDPDRLAQAVLNLVVNAHRHTPAGTVIDVSVHDDDGTTSIVVADNGPGIDPSIRDHMFEPFITSGTASSDGEDHSAGLGLAVVAAIVRAHHGTIEVDSSDKGTRIALCLPAAGMVRTAHFV